MTCGECKHCESRQNPDFGICRRPVPLWVTARLSDSDRTVWLTQTNFDCPCFERKEEK